MVFICYYCLGIKIYCHLTWYGINMQNFALCEIQQSVARASDSHVKVRSSELWPVDIVFCVVLACCYSENKILFQWAKCGQEFCCSTWWLLCNMFLINTNRKSATFFSTKEIIIQNNAHVMNITFVISLCVNTLRTMI